MPRIAFVSLTVFMLIGCSTASRERRPKENSQSPVTVVPRHPTNKAPGDKNSAIAEDSGASACEGKQVITLESYYLDGRLQRRQQTVKDEDGREIAHGLTAEFYEDGQKKLEVHFDCGVKHGPRITWHPNGQIWSQGEHIHGKDHGTWTVWNEDGTKAQEFTVKDGVWDGPFNQWHANGKKKLEVEYVNGMRQGMLTAWDEDGRVITRVEHVDGKPQPTP